MTRGAVSLLYNRGMLRTEFDFCIVGGGFAGAACAYFLSRDPKGVAGSVLLLEQEKSFGVHASGNNAAMLRQSVADEAVGRLAARSMEILRNLNGAVRAKPKGSPCGSLFLASKGDREKLRDIDRVARSNRIPFSFLDKAQVVKRIPILKGGLFDYAASCPTDGVIDTSRLLSCYVEGAKKGGITVLKGTRLVEVRRNDRARLELVLKTGGSRRIIRAKTLVNAAGAWSNMIARMAGLKPMPLKSCRRHLVFAPRPARFETSWPYIWDLSHQFYFRPFSRSEILLSPCDEEECMPVVGRMAIAGGSLRDMRMKLKTYLPPLAGIMFERATCELRTLSRDNRFVIGPDPRDERFFWISGLGGHGVTTSAGIGELSAQLLAGRKADARLARSFAPSRFSVE